jgi:hypothetical protein
MNSLDLTGITWTQVLIAAMIVAIVDIATGILGAIGGHTFNSSFLADFLSTHVLSRVIPIAGSALLSQELGNTPGGQALFGVALFGLGAYILQTLPSVGSNLALGPLAMPFTVTRTRMTAVPVVIAPLVPVAPVAAVIPVAPAVYVDPGTPSGQA